MAATGACATRGDVRLLRQDIAVLRVESVRADSARRAQVQQVGQELAQLSVFTDSLRMLSQRLSRLQGDLQSRLYAIDQQLVQIQELTGQSTRRIQEIRASIEERALGGAADSSGNPGPNQLLQIALDQIRRGSYSAGRTALEDLLRSNPPPDLAADAQYYIGEAFVAEGDTAQAVPAYALVLERYPRSTRAPAALYKQGIILLAQRRTAQARTLLQRVVSRYPSSDEATLARDRLRTIR